VLSVDIQEYKKSNQLSKWAEMVSACRNSGKTVAAWCNENGINEKTYYYRQKKVCDAVPARRKAAAIPVAQSNATVHFAEITPANSARTDSSGVTVRLGNAEVHIQNGAEATTIETVLRVLSGIC
jgi:putative transposase